MLRSRRTELEAAGHAVLVVDGDDHLDMSVPECMVTGGRLNLNMYGELGYHATAVGNNELMRFSLEQVRALSTESTVPWLLANLREPDGSLVGAMRDRLLVDFGGGLKVGLTGITDPFPEYESGLGLKIAPAADVVREAAEDMRAAGATLVVLLSHAGYPKDLELAPHISDVVDVIVGGHSHTVLSEPVTESGVLIVQAGSHGRFLGELCLELDEETGRIVRYTGELLPIADDESPDAAQASRFADAQSETNRLWSEQLLHLEQPLCHDELVSWAAEAMRRYYDAELGIVMGGIATGGWDAGPVTVGHVYRTCASLICVAHLEMQGRQFLGLLRETQNPEIYDRKMQGNGFRPRGIPFGRLQFAGLTWREENGEFVDVHVNGEPLDPERWYRVGTGEHLHYPEACKHPSLAGSRLLHVDDYFYVKDALIEFLRQKS